LPYLDEYWRDSVVDRGMNSLDSISYPPNAPLTARRTGAARPASRTYARRLAQQRARPLEHRYRNLQLPVCVQLLYSEDMAAAFAKAVNDWVAKEWLDRDTRLRASIVVPMQNTGICRRRDRAMRV